MDRASFRRPQHGAKSNDHVRQELVVEVVDVEESRVKEVRPLGKADSNSGNWVSETLPPGGPRATSGEHRLRDEHSFWLSNILR